MSGDADKTAPKQQIGVPFPPGQSGNPKGRPKGSKNKLSEEFLADLLADWQQGGVAALKEARANKPTEYCKLVASLVPKEITVKNDLSEFSDEQLAALGELAASLLGDVAGVAGKDRKGNGSKARH